MCSVFVPSAALKSEGDFLQTAELLKKLIIPAGVAGDERGSFEELRELLSQYGEVKSDSSGNITVTRDGEGKHILLDAHFDTVGFVVTGIEEGGFLRLSKVGGPDMRTAEGTELTVHGKEDIFAVICTVPPHLSQGESRVSKDGSCVADTGMSTENLSRVVREGDRAGFKISFDRLGENCVSSPYTDNRAGAAVLLKALQYTKTKNKITLLLSAQEETGSAGAVCAGFKTDADMALAVDVSFALTPDSKASECGVAGKGPMIGFSPVLSRELSELLVKTAEENSIPCQREIMGGRTGTNADYLAVSRGAIPSALVSVPQKYMHTPVETVDLRDIESCAELVARFLERV